MDYRKILIIILVFIVLATVGFIVSSNLLNFASPASATIKDKTFKLLVAKSEEEKQVGLSKHENLARDSGMIFLFEKADFYSFWMKDMKFPIDILYINGGRIVTIYKNQEPQEGSPPVLIPKEEADKVLEINAGLSDEYKFQEGDKVEFKNLE